MNRSWLTHVLIGTMLVAASCSSKDDNEEGKIEVDIIGTWIASSGKYNLSLEITPSGYSFLISEPGNGGIIDKGTYEISGDGKISFVNKETPLCIGGLQNGKLSVMFVNPILISMLGTAAAGNTVFTLSDKEDNDGTDDDDGDGFLAIINDGENNIVAITFYDEDDNFLDSDSDALEPGYYFEYRVMPGNYMAKVTDSKNKTFKSKPFKIVKNKLTILEYDGTAIVIIGTGLDYFDLSKSSAPNMSLRPVSTTIKRKAYKLNILNDHLNN